MDWLRIVYESMDYRVVRSRNTCGLPPQSVGAVVAASGPTNSTARNESNLPQHVSSHSYDCDPQTQRQLYILAEFLWRAL